MNRFLILLLVAALLASVFAPVNPTFAQTTPESRARALLSKLTTEERVGQLFLVSFAGTDVSAQSKIYDLITQRHVGGVVLLAKNNNFVALPDTLPAANSMIAGLQDLEWSNSQLETQTADEFVPEYVPLFVGISQQGDGLPVDQILGGTSSFSPELALGATWDVAQAGQTGEALGGELSALGVNFLLGPSLDMFSGASAVTQGDVGTFSFGGDPYWTGRMGQAYIKGLHAGSNGRLAVISRNFPGSGEADRFPQDEVATVRKSLEQLTQIELAPFFAVTGDAPETSMQTDGLLVTHIRYQGFQGNIRATTRPVSFDPQALGMILGLEPFAGWRESGGVVVSDDLGTSSVQRFYDPSGQNFSAVVVARDAFLAGNDLLYMGNILSSGDASNYDSLVRTIDFFVQKYNEDPSFAERVDESVLRILTLKFRMYEQFDYTSVVPSPDDINQVGNSGLLADAVARRSASLLSPDATELDTLLPDPPKFRERIIFITDNRTGRQCLTCADSPYIPTNALQSAVLRFYGPQGGGQVSASRLSSFTFDDIDAMLSGNATSTDFEGALSAANWVVISTLDLPPSNPHSDLLTRFLSEKENLLRDKKVVLFAFSAPYYLGATDISKLAAYYCIYGKSQPFIDTAARILFKEITPTGKSPVSVPGIGYDLNHATAPDPNQLIDLSLDFPPASDDGSEATPGPTPVPLFSVGDVLSARTGIILDTNANPVPDGTVVKFVMKLEEGLISEVITETKDGWAAASFQLAQPGLAEISASSEPAMSSVVLQVDVTPGEAVAVTVIVPTQMATPQETLMPTPTLASPEESDTSLVQNGFPLLSGWFFSILLITFGAGMMFIIASQSRPVLWSLRWSVCVVLGGLAAYNYIVFGLPGSQYWIEQNGFVAILVFLIMGMVLGAIAAYVWERLSSRKSL